MACKVSTISRIVHIICCLVVFSGEVSAQQGWQTYCNPRFGQCADVPPNFQSDPPPENGDGLIFRHSDGMSIIVSAMYNVLSATVSLEMKELLQDKRSPSYQASGHNWFAISGEQDGKIYYIRKIVTPDIVASLWIEYPVQQRAAYDPLIARISKSFKLGH